MQGWPAANAWEIKRTIGQIHSSVISAMSSAREKVDGITPPAFLQLPAREVRFRCTSMPKISPPQY
jgi:hypothetical protein